LKRYTGIFICIILALIAAGYFTAHRTDFMELWNMAPMDLAFLVGMNLVTRVLVGARLKYLTAPFGLKLSLREGTALSFIQAYGNVVAIKGGTVAIAYYLYSEKNFGLDRFISITGGGFVVTILSISAAGLIGIGLVSLHSGVGPEIPFFFSIIFLGALALLILPSLRMPLTRITKFVKNVMEGWDVLRSSRLNLFRLVAVEIAILMSFAIRYYIAFRGFSQSIRLSQAFILAPPAYLSLMLNFTPAGLGIREPILAYMSGILGYTVKGGLGAAILDSAVMVIISLAIGPFVAPFFMRRKGEADASA